ncbi:chemotaxis protein CheW, partial [bacterium]|nr:chemotaxis protein CheW [bacterium]
MSEENELLMLEEDTQEGKFLTFKINQEDYGISIRFNTEIIGINKISPLHDLEGSVKGVCNLRG